MPDKWSNPAGATFGRADVARLLGIEEWRIASYSDDRYAYKIRPTARRARGTGTKGLYSLTDVYKIALADRMLALGLESLIIGPAIRALFPRGVNPIESCITRRVKNIEDVRYLVINFALAPWVQQNKLPQHWREGSHSEHEWVMLLPWKDVPGQLGVSSYFGSHKVRSAFLIPFDELLAEVDARLLGRQFNLGDFFDFSSWPPIPDSVDVEGEEE